MAEAAGLNPVQRGFDPRRGYCHGSPPTIVREMTLRSEDDPDEEPDEPARPNQPGDGAPAMGPLPSVGMPAREWEFSTQVLSVAQVADGTTLVKLLQEAGADGWDLAEVIDGGDKRVLLLRRPKRSSHESRRVGFAPPIRN